jgi:tRNA (guanosine-2'-O-)-methyltransferase
MTDTRRLKFNKVSENRQKTFICVLENPKQAVNIGTVIRNISAFGISKLYIINNTRDEQKDWETDIRYNKELKTFSVGTNKWVFVKCFASTEECMNHLNTNGFRSICTSPHNKLSRVNCDLTEYDGFTYSKIAVWFGNEHSGISESVIKNCGVCIQIPTYGVVESLNLAVTTGIVLHHITNIRRSFCKKKVFK